MAGLIITDLIAITLSFLKILPVLQTTWRHWNNSVNDIYARTAQVCVKVLWGTTQADMDNTDQQKTQNWTWRVHSNTLN